MARIQIFSVMGKNGVIFSQFLRETMIKLASGQNELEFNCFMSSKVEPPKGWKNLEHIIKQKHTSLNHTTGLNRALDYINGDFVICSDVDVAMLCSNWDSMMIEEMEKQNLDIFGVGHRSDGRGYRNFPIVTFFMAKSYSHLRAQPDLRPALIKYPNKYGQGAEVIRIETEKESFIFGKKRGHSLLKDSGWQLPYCYKNAGLKGQVFTEAPEYQIQYVPQTWVMDGKFIVGHKGKSSKRRQSHGFKFTKSIATYIAKVYGIELKR